MRDLSSSPIEMLRSVWRNRALIYFSAKRDILGRYQGSFFGLLWSFLNPFLMLIVYTFVFGQIFKATWRGDSDSTVEFALVLFAGMIIFNFFSECINKAPTLVLAHPNYVKKVIYPLEILPLVSIVSGLYHAALSLFIWLLAYCLLRGIPNSTALMLPLVIVPLVLSVVGVSWFLASIGVFFRDVSQFVSLTTTALMFLSPIFYPITSVPEEYRPLIYLNPLTSLVEITRGLLYWGTIPSWSELTLSWICSLTAACLGFAWFQKTRKGFADVL